MGILHIPKLYCKRKDRMCWLADADGNCVADAYRDTTCLAEEVEKRKAAETANEKKE